MGSVYPKRRRTAAVQKEGDMTTAEYLATEETVLPRELAYGVLRVADSPGGPHQRIVGRLHLAMAPAAAADRDRREAPAAIFRRHSEDRLPAPPSPL